MTDLIPTLAASVAVFALVFIVPGLAFLNLPSRRRTAGDIINDNGSRRPVRAWPEYRSSSVASSASPPVRGDATDLEVDRG